MSSIDAIEPTYKLIDLGLQESDRSEAVAVNDNGQVVGAYWMFGNKYYFSWTEDNGITLIDLPESAVIVVLNNAGQIAGNYKDSTNKDRGFIWDQQNGFYDIGTLGGGFTRVYDMNELGQIVGESESENISFVDERLEQHAFLWQWGSMVDLGSLTGDLGVLGDRSVATSINDHGQIIGTSNSLIAHKRSFLRELNRAVAWQNGVIKEINPTLEHKHVAWSFSVNNNGFATYYNTLQGCFSVDLSTWEITKNQWDRKFVISDLGDMYFHAQNFNGNPNRTLDFIIFNGENEHAHLYFYSSFDAPNVWKQNSFSGAYDFNNKRWIVGIAENIYGEHHAVLLVPIKKSSESETIDSMPEDIIQDSESLNQEISETIEIFIQNTIDASFIYHTNGIEEKVRLLFLDHYAQDQNGAHFVREPYRKLLLIEALDAIFIDVEKLAMSLGCENSNLFWETVRFKLTDKSSEWTQSVDAYIKLRATLL